MNFLVDAQLPRRLADWLNQAGFDTIHTLDLPQKNRTPDSEISLVADAQSRVLITKDADFAQSFVLRRTPAKILLITTGNISNSHLLLLFKKNINSIVTNLKNEAFIEMDVNRLIIRN